MKKVAWAPFGISAELELIAVMVQPGNITETQWIDALADRVTEMAIQEKPVLTSWACHALGTDVGDTDNPRHAGRYLVSGNFNLREHFSVAMYDGNPFPCVAEEKENARHAIENSDLELWVELARAMTNP
jgi:hypothetical protein